MTQTGTRYPLPVPQTAGVPPSDRGNSRLVPHLKSGAWRPIVTRHSAVFHKEAAPRPGSKWLGISLGTMYKRRQFGAAEQTAEG